MKTYNNDRFSQLCGADLAYGFYGRQGGVSAGIYDSLNCGPGSSDRAEHVAQNRTLVAQHLGVPDQKISTLSQCHSALCFAIKEHVPEGNMRPEGDALVTDVAGLGIGVLTADCGPVLFCARKANGDPVVGAAHAGWGGALGGVLEETVSKMVHLGARLESIAACVGPCIHQPSYEVETSFCAPFIEKHEEAERFFMAGSKPGHLMFDLPGYIAYRLSLCGVGTVILTGYDTYAREQDFFSYRRATHRGESDYGREMSAIVIKG